MGNCCDKDAKATSHVYSGTTASIAVTSSKTNSSSQVDSSLASFDWSCPNSGDMSRHSSAIDGSLRAFSYGDLKAATRNFRTDGILGEGGFGVVFKGYVDAQTLMPSRPVQGMIVAIKKLKLEGVQGHREWLAEVHFLGALHHPNLVKLFGFCAEESNRLLVYEYMPRGSLENHLFRKGNHHQTIPWAIRMKVAVGAARGLAFLHGAQRQVIYRDFKASNILLDDEYNAKLSDFGLAKDGPMGDDTHVSTRIMGTHGYAAPEYLATGHLSARSDVYSFGVVLLELLTGLRSVDSNRPHGQQKLVDWARPYLGNKNRVLRIFDEKMEGQYSFKAANRAANLALMCLNEDAKSRPTMKEIVDSLEPLLNARQTSKYAMSDH